jgi:hypothetical protein
VSGNRRQYNIAVLAWVAILYKPVYTEPLSITVPVVICTCMVLVGTIVSIPVLPQFVPIILGRLSFKTNVKLQKMSETILCGL